MFRRLNGSESGFSLIETLAAITVFAFMTVGMTPLIVSSLRGTALSRSQTVARNLASEAMERVRGLPYYDTSANVDFLDFYFPNTSTGYSAGVFTTTCTPTSQTPSPSAARACPVPHADVARTQRIPAGYTVQFDARFVVPSGTSSESFTIVTPTATYNSATESTSIPPSQLVRLTITVSWTQLGRARSFSLDSVIGDRKLSADKVRATATIDYGVRVQSAYVGTDGTVSGLTGIGVRSTSDIEIRSVAAASIDSAAGSVLASREESATTAGGVIDAAYGAQASLRTPPNTVPGLTSAASDSVTIPGLLAPEVGFIDATAVNEATPAPGVSIVDGLPKAATNAVFTGGVGDYLWITNQADFSSAATKKFESLLGGRMFTVSRPTGRERILSNTLAEATATTPVASRRVRSTASIFIPRIALFDTTFAPNGVVQINDFSATLACTATGISSPASTATGSWTATIRYWDASQGVGGGYTPALAIDGNVSPTRSVDPLAAIKTANPLVIDGSTITEDVYLFETPTTVGYLENWSTNFAMTREVGENTSRVSMPFAINLETARTSSANAESKIAVEVGKMSCQAVDNRA